MGFFNYIVENIFEIIKIPFTLFIVTWKKGTDNMLLNIITHDSIFSSIDCMIDIIKTNENNIINNIINNKKSVYKYGIIDRYLYYIIINLFTIMINLLLWDYYKIIIYWIVMITTIPNILNIILDNRKYKKIKKKIMNPLNKIFRFLILNCLSYIINNICINSINNNPELKYNELTKLIDKDKKIEYDPIINFIKIFCITSLIYHFENKNRYYGSIVKFLYKYGSIIDINQNNQYIDPFPLLSNKYDKIIFIIKSRKWIHFYNPKILKLLIEIYKENNNKNNLYDLISNKLNLLETYIIRWSTIYSIVSIINIPILIPIISLIFIYYQPLYKNNHYQIIFRLLSLIFIYFDFSILTISLFSEFIDIFDNRITYWIIYISNKWINSNYNLFFQNNSYNYYFLILFLLYYFFGFIFVNYPILIPIFIILSKYPFFTFLLSFSILSNFNFFHILLIIFFNYIYINILLNNNKNNHLILNIIENYDPSDNNK